MGRLIIEKLLRSCPDIENIFILVKPENGEDLQEVVNRVVLNFPIFENIRKNRPNDLNKIIPIKGDLMLRFFGMTLEDLELLKDKISVIIHSTFTYQRNEKLKAAVEKNLLPVKELMKMCHFMKKLDVCEFKGKVFIDKKLRFDIFRLWFICHLFLLFGIIKLSMRLLIHHLTNQTRLSLCHKPFLMNF
jgi:hypothetical protein